MNLWMLILSIYSWIDSYAASGTKMTSSRTGAQTFRPVKAPRSVGEVCKCMCRMADTQAPGLRKRSALVLYGSETGNAQEVAEELGALAERLRFVTHVSEMDHARLVRLFCGLV